MAMVKCPECGKEVSDKSFKCVNCGFVLNKPKRGITGIIFKSLFILFNAIMILWVISVWSLGSSNPEVELGAAKAMGTGMLIFIWILIGLPLGIMNYITRPKAYE